MNRRRRPKKSKARTRFDHVPNNQRGYAAGGSGGGLSFSNETSLNNPLNTISPQMMAYYKRINEQKVQQDPYGRRFNPNRFSGPPKDSFKGKEQPQRRGGNDGNYKSGRGGVAFNL